jgi:uncharacterized protein with FMN-binding domain
MEDDMKEKQPAAYYVMLLVTVIFTALAVITLIPNAAASKPTVLGYRSHCSFAPASTALCLILAGITCTIRSRAVSRTSSSRRYRPPFIPILAGLALAAVALVSGIAFGRAQSRFVAVIERTAPLGAAFSGLADGTRSAAAAEGEVSATVEVTVASGRITDLKLKSAVNVERSVANAIFSAVKAAQSGKVDAVSGATASSQVLLKAIEAAAAGK